MIDFLVKSLEGKISCFQICLEAIPLKPLPLTFGLWQASHVQNVFQILMEV